MGLSKLMRAALTVNPLARTKKAKDLATTRTRLEAILRKDSGATDAQRKKAREKLDQMDKVEAEENIRRKAKAAKFAPESAAKKEKLAPAPLKSLEGLPDDFNRGGTPKKKKVPVISIGIGRAEFPKSKKKTKMMRGGMANGKPHMYSNGGSVTDNAGLRALKASGPKGLEAYNKITKS